MIRSWLARLRNALHPDAIGSEIDREMAFHLEERAASLEREGMDPSSARLEARRRFGNLGLQREATRERDLFAWVETLVFDLKYALRGLRAAPGFTAVILLSLGLGIGANTAIFSLINVAMLKTLPVRAPEELVQIVASGTGNEKSRSHFNQRLWEAFRDHQDALSGVFAYGSTGMGDLSLGGEARPVTVGMVTGQFFSVLGVHPAAGRLLSDSDDVKGCPGVVVITYEFWQGEFGGDLSAVGRTVRVNGHPLQVIGVAEPTFFGLGYGYYPPLWTPQCAIRIVDGAISRGGIVIGRLKPGLSIEEARPRIARLAPLILPGTIPRGLDGKEIERYLASRFDVEPFARGFRFLDADYGQAFLILMGIVGVILLIACVNSANLMLARATARRREMAVRLALGASRMRLIRQLLTESLLLSLLSAGVGALFAVWGTSVLLGFMGRRDRPMVLSLTPDLTVLGFAIGISILTGVLFGLAPAWRATRAEAQSSMKADSRGLAEGQSRFAMGKGLVVAQIALSLVMVAGAGLLIGSWRRLMSVDAGFKSEGVVVVSVNTHAAAIPDSLRRGVFLQILNRLRALPEVEFAAAADRTPMGNTNWSADARLSGVEGTRNVSLNLVSEGFFAAMQTRMLAGRDFDLTDSPTNAKVAIVSSTVARHFGGPAAAVGKRISLLWSATEATDYTIIGVVSDTRERSLDQGDVPAVYTAMRQNLFLDQFVRFVAKARTGTVGLSRAVGAAILESDARLSLTTRTLDDQVQESARLPRTLGVMGGFFGAVALFLASIGLYGIMSYTVARRRNEIGVRIALGAEPKAIVAMVLGDVGRIVTIGVILGVILALATLRLADAALYGVRSNDLRTLVLSSLVLGAIGVIAALGPARRAARIDPVSAIRD